MRMPIEYQRLTLLGMVAVASGLVGCSVFQDKTMPKLSAEVTSGPAQAFPPAGKYVMEFRPEKGKPQAIERDATDQLHMQLALDQSGAAKKWARMQIDLYRPLPSGGWHKMTIEFDRETHRVPPEFDYAVLPGDRIVVTQDTTTIMDDVLQRTLEPLGIVPAAKRKQIDAAKKYQVRG